MLTGSHSTGNVGENLPLRPPVLPVVARTDSSTGYFININDVRKEEYPMLQGQTYLDHAGTTLYPTSLVKAISYDLTTNLFGNPHSASSSSQLSSRRVDDARLQTLRFLNADPNLFDVVFVANATAAIKLVGDALKDKAEGFHFVYHVDSHTSLTGLRALAKPGSQCLQEESAITRWLSEFGESSSHREQCILFGYPGQSNLSGYRPPLRWCSQICDIRSQHGHQIYSLYDAAARLSTSPMDFSNARNAPDFTAVSFYKIFGLPDLGALVVRKECSNVFRDRKFFGGGTVDMVISLEAPWHAKKHTSLHSSLEDGTIPFHNVIALNSAFSTHLRLFGSMDHVSRHTSFLARRLHDKLSSLTHLTGVAGCQIYGTPSPDYGNTQGPTIAFNLRDPSGDWIRKSEVEKLATINNFQIRTGDMCNPGGVAQFLDLSASELRANFAAGQRCGDDNDILNGKPTGAIRVSLGAMSSIEDIDKFIEFLEEYFIQVQQRPPTSAATPFATKQSSSFHVQSLSIFPIKSCAAFNIPNELAWEVGEGGLAWDREWCLIHQGTGVALNQKRYPPMAKIRPIIDLEHRYLTVQHDIGQDQVRSINISLDLEAGDDQISSTVIARPATVCGEEVEVQSITSADIAEFFTAALDVPCTLARYRKPATSLTSDISQCIPQKPPKHPLPARVSSYHQPRARTMFANESPILLISQASLDQLNTNIAHYSPRSPTTTTTTTSSCSIPIPADSFRANIVIAQSCHQNPSPYAEDVWTSIQIGKDPSTDFHVLGPCHRCQMVCVDQRTGERRSEPFSTLAKTRRRKGKVWFGIHMTAVVEASQEQSHKRVIKVGDIVNVS